MALKTNLEPPNPKDLELSVALDTLGPHAIGNTLYRSSAGWTVLAPGNLNDVLISGGAGSPPAWGVAGSGSVSSVGLSAPAEFTVSGSPVVGAGTLTFVWAAKAANIVLAGPTTGGPSTPAFRSLVGADLPNPSSSTLGGIQSVAAVANNWIASISTSGVPSLSQPAFSNISGTVAASQLPNPSASTLGGIQSLAAVTHRWINTISTSGVPSATQPSFTDINGQIDATQFPSISNNTVIANTSGGTAAPLPTTVTAVLDVIGSTRGNILYRGASSWSVLAPDTLGKVLSTNGAGADPSWVSVAGTGTVTQVDSGTGITLTPASITTSGSVALAAIANQRILANVSGGSLAPSATTATAVLDIIGATQGEILYRGASVWTALSPGTNGQVLQTTGAGSGPQWANVGSVSSIGVGGGITTLNGTSPITASGAVHLQQMIPGGRLTLTSATPVMAANATAQQHVYYAPYVHPFIPVYDGTVMRCVNYLSSETDNVGLDLNLAGSANWGIGKLFDVFYAELSGVLYFGTGPDWTAGSGSLTARGTGAGSTELQLYNGIWTNKNQITLRTGAATTQTIAANHATYLGTIYTTAAGKTGMAFTASSSGVGTGGGGNILGLYNAYNRVLIRASSFDTSATWTYGSTTWRKANGSSNNSISYVDGLQQSAPSGKYDQVLQSAASSGAQNGCAFDWSSGAPSYVGLTYGSAGSFNSVSTLCTSLPLLGFHTMNALEHSYDGTLFSYYGFGFASPGYQVQQLSIDIVM